MFQDEGRFDLLGTPRRCWAPRGVRPVVGARVQRKYLYAFSAVSPHDGVLDSLVLPWVNAETMSLFLDEVARRHADEFVFMVMDQAGWHIAGELQVPPNMRLMFLPPYSPDLNPIEMVFAKLKGLLRSTQARTQETLWSAIGSLLERFTAQECRDYIRHCGYYHSG